MKAANNETPDNSSLYVLHVGNYGAGCYKIIHRLRERQAAESAYSSINGYGTFRQALDNAGFTDRDIGQDSRIG